MVRGIGLFLVVSCIAGAPLFATGEQEGAGHRTLELVRWHGPQESVHGIEVAWAKEFPDSTLQISLGSPIDQYIEARLAQNNLPDMWYTSPFEWTQNYARRGMTRDLEGLPFVDKLIPATPRAGLTYDGKIYAYPAAGGFMGAFYNKDVFADAGIAEERKTISDLKSMIGKFEALGVVPWSTPYKDIWPMVQGFQQMMANAVGQDEFWNWVGAMNEGEQTYDVPKFRQMMEVWDLIKEHGTPNAMDVTYTKQIANIAEGKAAIYLNNESSIGEVISMKDDSNIGAMGEPVSDDPNDSLVGFSVSIAIVVAKDTKNWDLVQQFFEWCIDSQYWQDGKANYHSEMADMWGIYPLVPYDGPGQDLGGALEDLLYYRDQGWITPWMRNHEPPGSYVEMANALQGYYLGELDVDEFISKLDENWHSLAAKAKAAKAAAQ